MENSVPLFQRSSLKVLELPPSTVPKCHECQLFAGCKAPKLGVAGEGRKGILVITTAPTEAEDRAGKRLPHPRLAAEFRRHGVDLMRDCWVDSSLMCRPPGGKPPDKPPAVDHCRPHLINTVQDLKPKVIIPLGADACKGLLGWLWKEDVGPIQRWAGYRIPHRATNAWVCPTYMPGEYPWFSDRVDPVLERHFGDHVRAALKYARPPYGNPPHPDSEFCEVVLDTDKAAEIVDNVAADAAEHGLPIAFDYETTTLKPHGPHARIHSCSLAWTEYASGCDHAIAFPWQGKVIPAMKRMFVNPKVKKVGSNCKFEHSWTRQFLGVGVKGWQRDTMLASHALENGSKSRRITGIKFQAFVHLGIEEWDSGVKKWLTSDGGNTPNRITEAPLDEVLTYCALDGLFELQVARIQTRMIEEGKK